jgi:hypothetical protein
LKGWRSIRMANKPHCTDDDSVVVRRAGNPP